MEDSMKKRTITLVALLLVAVSVMSIGLTACGLFDDDDNGGSNTPSESVKYTIQYTDDNGTHTITVESGQPYSIDLIPERKGYEFTGLYDAQTGGTQYVAANGSSVSPFTDNKNMVLFPQFKAKQYKVVLNYGDAPVTGMREIDVDYNTELPELPINLTVANKDFKGWFTEPNCGGTQIADTYGVLPDRRIVTEQNFDLSNANGYIYLYAGFTGTMRTITFYVGDGNAPIVMQVEHGTLISDVVPYYRDEDGYAVLEWTQESNPTDNSAVFKGEVTHDMTLYAKTFAPVIEFDANGGEDVTPLVQTAGRNITLPTPVRANYKFLYWTDASGEKAAYSTMPSESVELTAVWQAMLVFDENGGVDVNDISQEANTSVTLPTPEREGYIFAGWYTTSGEKYESTRMPVVSEVLKAGWYKAKSARKSFLADGTESTLVVWKSPQLVSGYKINFNEEIAEVDWTQEINVILNYHADIRHAKTRDQYVSYPTYATKEHFYFYSQEQVSDAYLLGKCLIDHGNGTVNESYVTVDFSLSLKIKGGMLYVAVGADKDNFYKQYGSVRCGSGWIMTNFWVDIEYPDTSVMY